MRTGQKINKATDELRGRLDVWRKTRRPGLPIPPELWDEAMEPAARQGIWKTSRALHIDYSALRKRVKACTSERPISPVPQFVELLAPLSVQIAECTLKVESPRGARLRIEMKNVAASGLVPIIREFAE